MPLHDKQMVREEMIDDIYASRDLSVDLADLPFPEREHDPRHAFQVVRDGLMLAGGHIRETR